MTVERKVEYGNRYSDSIGVIWEVVELPKDRDDGKVKLWNRSYNAFDKKTVEEVQAMKAA